MLDSERLLLKYPGRVAIIIHPGPNAPPIDKNKYLVPNTLKFGEFMHIVRKRISVNQYQALVGFVNGDVLPPSNQILSELPRNKDGFIYVTYSLENTFG
jgi:GABA(A) receptor-associated protein